MKKHTYEQPLAETFELSIQNTILDGSPDGTWGKSIKPGTTWGSTEGEDPYGME